MFDLFEKLILLSFQEFKHPLKAIFLIFQKCKVIVVPEQSLIMVVLKVLVEMHSWFCGQEKGITKKVG